MRQCRPWLWYYTLQSIHLLWLAPVTVFLAFNHQNRVIGASVWCPFGHCASNAFNDGAMATAVKYQKSDQDTLAGLQFAAQGIQVCPPLNPLLAGVYLGVSEHIGRFASM